MTVTDKSTGTILFKTTGSDEHLQRFGHEVHYKLKDNNNFSVHIEDFHLLGFDMQEAKSKIKSIITVERVFITVNLLINGLLIFKLFGK